MSQVGLAEQVWTHLSKMFPKMPTEMREASDSSSCTRLPLLLLPRAVTQVSSPLLTTLSLATSQEEAVKGTSASLSLPSPCPAPSLSRHCSPPPPNILLHALAAQEASFLSLPVKPPKPRGYLLRFVSPPGKSLTDKALLFYKRFWPRVSQATPNPKDTDPGATLHSRCPLKRALGSLCAMCVGTKALLQATARPSAQVGAGMALQDRTQPSPSAEGQAT